MTDEQIREVCKKYADSASFYELFWTLTEKEDQHEIIDALPIDWLRERIKASKEEEWELWLEIEV